MSNLRLSLVLALGGGIGTLARYWLGIAAAPYSQSMPWGTVAINIIGSFIIGFAGSLTLADGRWPVSETTRLFIMVGLCGGFTTFSAFSLQNFDLLRDGAYIRLAVNVVVSVTLCLAAVAGGHYLATRFNPGASLVAQIEDERLS